MQGFRVFCCHEKSSAGFILLGVLLRYTDRKGGEAVEYGDLELVHGIKGGDKGALELLVRRWYPRVYGYVTIRAMISVFVPTAASASALPKLPTTAVSAALNSCCTMLLSAIGSVNRSSLPASGPCSISSSDDLCFIFLAPECFLQYYSECGKI